MSNESVQEIFNEWYGSENMSVQEILNAVKLTGIYKNVRVVVPGQDGGIQAAVDAASSGDIVLVFPGTYEITAPIECKAGVRIVGLTGAGIDAGDKVAVVAANDASIENLTIITTNDYGVSWDGSDGTLAGFSVLNCNITAKIWAVYVANSTDLVLKNNYLISPNPIWLSKICVRPVVVSNTCNYTGAGQSQCLAFLDMDESVASATCVSHSGLFANNVYNGYRTSGTSFACYGFRLRGYGHRFVNNHIHTAMSAVDSAPQYHMDIKPTPVAEGDTVRPNIVSGNIINIDQANPDGTIICCNVQYGGGADLILADNLLLLPQTNAGASYVGVQALTGVEGNIIVESGGMRGAVDGTVDDKPAGVVVTNKATAAPYNVY